jgi:hypothetical protein
VSLAKINETDTFGPGDDDEIQFDDIGDDDEDIDDVSRCILAFSDCCLSYREASPLS